MLKLLDENGVAIEKETEKPEEETTDGQLEKTMAINQKRKEARAKERDKKNKEVLRTYRIKN